MSENDSNKCHVGSCCGYVVQISSHFSKLMWQFIADIDVYQVGAGQASCHIFSSLVFTQKLLFWQLTYASHLIAFFPIFLFFPAGCQLEHLSIRAVSMQKNGNHLIFFVNKVSWNKNILVLVSYSIVISTCTYSKKKSYFPSAHLGDKQWRVKPTKWVICSQQCSTSFFCRIGNYSYFTCRVMIFGCAQFTETTGALDSWVLMLSYGTYVDTTDNTWLLIVNPYIWKFQCFVIRTSSKWMQWGHLKIDVWVLEENNPVLMLLELLCSPPHPTL